MQWEMRTHRKYERRSERVQYVLLVHGTPGVASHAEMTAVIPSLELFLSSGAASVAPD
jgi:hypothetical protein